MAEIINKIKNLFAWIGEKNERIVLSTIIFIFIVVPILVVLMIFGMPNFSPNTSVSSFGRGMMGYSDGVVSKSISYAVGGGSPAPMMSADFFVQENASTPALPFDKKIIKNGSLNLIVNNTEESILKINDIAKSFEGFLENSNVYEVSDGVKSGNITVRVPSKNFTSAMEAFKKVAVKVSNESVSSNDVTAQYVDLEAEVKNYKAEEIQYREIMSKAVKIEDVLNVSAKLAEVRGKIDRTQAQINYLSRQVEMSTISLSLTGESEVKIFGIVWRPFTVLKQSIRNLFADLANLADWIIGFIFRLPVLIIKLVLFVLVIFVAIKVFKKIINFLWK
jgi:hypothetical protein